MDDDDDSSVDLVARARRRREADIQDAIESGFRTLGRVLAAPFVVGWTLIYGAAVGTVWLIGLLAIAGVVGVAYALIR